MVKQTSLCTDLCLGIWGRVPRLEFRPCLANLDPPRSCPYQEAMKVVFCVYSVLQLSTLDDVFLSSISSLSSYSLSAVSCRPVGPSVELGPLPVLSPSAHLFLPCLDITEYLLSTEAPLLVPV